MAPRPPVSQDNSNDTKIQSKVQISYGRLLTSSIFTILAGPSKKAFYVHKEVLSNLSLELRKHTTNGMKEGSDNVMTLSDVLEDTMARFLEWAYTKDYPDDISIPPSKELPKSETAGGKEPEGASKADDPKETEPAPEAEIGVSDTETPSPVAPSARLLSHARVYIFAERFNIASLKSLAFTKITKIMLSLDYLNDPRDAVDVINLMTYSFENLPLTNSSELLLDYLSSYASWTLHVLRKNKDFWVLVDSNSDFCRALLKNSPEIENPPWKSGNTGARKDVKARKKELLDRSCNSCSWKGIFYIRCSSCNYYDWEINGSENGLDRLSGTKSNLKINCLYCNTTRSVGVYCAKCLNN